MVNLAEISLMGLRLKRNDIPIDLESCFERAAANKLKLYDGRLRRSVGEILMMLPDQPSSQVLYWIEKAIDKDTNNGTRWDLAKDYLLYGEWFIKTGRQPKAREYLGKALDIFKGCGADGWAAKTEKQLTMIS